MPLLKQINIDDGLLLLWKIDESLNELMMMASEATQHPVFKKITHQKRQKEWLAVRLLLQEIGCRSSEISYLENGQPQIVHPEFQQISISHSSQMAGIYLHHSVNVGLDIENSSRDFRRIEEKYLSPDEIQLANSINNGHGLFWCIKEAVYKAAGIPGISFAEQIKIRLNSQNQFEAELTDGIRNFFKINYFEFEGQLIVCLLEKERKDL